ncbi:MAG: hypothetical protein EON54_16290, partial [Alcaligenaceae bacterium]
SGPELVSAGPLVSPPTPAPVSVTGVPIDPGLPTVTATGASVGGLTSGPAETSSGPLLVKWSFSDGTQLTERSLFHYTFANGDFTNFRVTCNSIP